MDQREFEHRFRTAWHSLCLSVAAQDHASSEDERLAFLSAIVRACDECERLVRLYPEQARKIDPSPSDD